MEFISKCLFGILFCQLYFYFATSINPYQCVKCMGSQKCQPPDCFCCRDTMPIQVKQVPQMVFFTFDDAITPHVASFYRKLFDSKRKNPNGCSVKMTLFVSHANTLYNIVREFYNKGMEIGSHSVSHKNMNKRTFKREAKRQKQNLARKAKIPISKIKGWRSPFLKPIGDVQPNTLKELGYDYDATLTIGKPNLRSKAPIPFTLDYGWPYRCKIRPCPKTSHKGFWEVPVVTLMDYKQDYECVYVDGCTFPPPNEDSAFKFLWRNFESYYNNNRAPFGINMHASWFYYPDRLKAMDRFIRELGKLNDVYIVTVSQVISWLRQPTPLSEIKYFEPWGCGLSPPKPKAITSVSTSALGRNGQNIPLKQHNKQKSSQLSQLNQWRQLMQGMGISSPKQWRKSRINAPVAPPASAATSIGRVIQKTPHILQTNKRIHKNQPGFQRNSRTVQTETKITNPVKPVAFSHKQDRNRLIQQHALSWLQTLHQQARRQQLKAQQSKQAGNPQTQPVQHGGIQQALFTRRKQTPVRNVQAENQVVMRHQTEQQRLVEKEKQRAEKSRIAEQKRLVELRRIQEAKQIEEQNRIAELKRIEQAKKVAEQKRKEEEKRIAELKRIQEEEEQRLAELKRMEEQKRIEEAKRIAEQKRIEEEKRLAELKAAIEEQKRIAKEKKLAELRRLEEKRQAEEARKIAEQKRIAEEKRLAELKRIQEQERLAEEKRIAELRRVEEQKRIEEARRIAKQKRIEEEKRLAKLKRIQAAKKLAEQKRLAELKRIEEQKRAEEARLKRIEEEKRLAELRRIEEQKRIAEEKRLAELKRIQEEQQRIEEEKQKAEQKRIKEEKRLAELKRIQEQKLIEEENRLAELRRLEEQKELEKKKRMQELKRIKETKRIAEQMLSEQEKLLGGSKTKKIIKSEKIQQSQLDLTLREAIKNEVQIETDVAESMQQESSIAQQEVLKSKQETRKQKLSHTNADNVSHQSSSSTRPTAASVSTTDKITNQLQPSQGQVHALTLTEPWRTWFLERQAMQNKQSRKNQMQENDRTKTKVRVESTVGTSTTTSPSTTTRVTVPSVSKQNNVVAPKKLFEVSGSAYISSIENQMILPKEGIIIQRPQSESSSTTTTTSTLISSIVSPDTRNDTTKGQTCLQGVNCHAPDCVCKSETVPGGLDPKTIPQLVYITIDGDMNFLTYSRMRSLLSRHRTNPNGCPIRGTFFTSDRGFSFGLSHFVRGGNVEIALNGLRTNGYLYPNTMSRDINLQTEKLVKRQRIDKSLISGWRSPGLRNLGDTQFDILKNMSLYDSSLVTDRYEKDANKIWPFTLDFGWDETCKSPRCPQKVHPGVWEVPIIPLSETGSARPCVYADSCYHQPSTVSKTYKYLWDNFQSYYTANKAPFGIHINQKWFQWYYSHNLSGLLKFLDTISEMNDVYVVSVSNVIDWVKNPTTLADIKNFVPFQC